MVHVGRVHLEDSLVQAARYRPYLFADERARALWFREPHPQYQFIATRGILRRVLSHNVDVPVANLRIESSLQGKPELVDSSSPPLQF